jgi:hypothetical protein
MLSVSFIGALAVQSVVFANIGNLTTEVTFNGPKPTDHTLHTGEITFVWNLTD